MLNLNENKLKKEIKNRRNTRACWDNGIVLEKMVIFRKKVFLIT